MLSDLERKLHRILVNYPMFKREIPTFKRLEIMTGRKQSEIIKGLESLESLGFITWEDKVTTASIKVLRDYEVEDLESQQKSNINYWTLF